jgi:membrane fusion protein (multidrug efflux system)
MSAGRGAGIRRFVIAALSLPAVAGLSACDATQETVAVEAPPPAVTVAKVARVEVTPTSTFTGRIEAVDKVDLRARVEGFIERRLFEEGADVKTGDLMFVLEKAPYQAQIDEIEAAIAGAEAALKLASLDADRQTELVEKQVKAQAILDEALAKQAESSANLQRLQAALQKAQLDLGYTDIRAPVSGRVGRAAYSVGDFVGPSSGTLATIVSQDPIYVTFPISQRELLQVRREAAARGTDPRAVRVKLRLADGSLYEHSGAIDFVDVQVDAATDTIAIRAQLPNPDRLLVDGQLVTAIIESSVPETALVIPGEALQVDQAGRFVLVVDGENKVQVRRIETGRAYDGRMVVTKGLEEEERVVTIGAQKVRPQQVVAPTEVASAAAGS